MEAEQNCNILTPTHMGMKAFFPVLLGCSTGGLGPQPLWVLILSTASFCNWSELQPVWLPVFTGLYNCSSLTFFLWASQIALNSTRPQLSLYPDIPRPGAPVIYTGAFPILTAWPGSICYITIFEYLIFKMIPSYYK